MNFSNKILNNNTKLLNILSLTDLSKITKNEIIFFKDKKILITGVSGIIGINLLFFFDSIIKKKKIKSILREHLIHLFFHLLRIILEIINILFLRK